MTERTLPPINHVTDINTLLLASIAADTRAMRHMLEQRIVLYEGVEKPPHFNNQIESMIDWASAQVGVNETQAKQTR